jgi:hypothetical protein
MVTKLQAEVHKVFQVIESIIIEHFKNKKGMYARNFGHSVFGLAWHRAFQTDNRSEMEEYGRKSDVGFEWIDGVRLNHHQWSQFVKLTREKLSCLSGKKVKL